MSIDWSLPLETDEDTPRAVTWSSVRATGQEPPNSFAGRIVNTDETGIWNDQGIQVSGSRALPRIRNVRTVDTSRDEAFRRMEKLIRRVADHGVAEATEAASTLVEAREIVKLLPAPPVDPLLIEARKLTIEWLDIAGSPRAEDIFKGEEDSGAATLCHLAGLKRGQELAHGEYEICGRVRYSRGTYPTYQRRSEAAGIEPGK